MVRQIRLLTKLSLQGIGLNELLFTRDRRKRARGWLLGVAWAVLAATLAFYVCMVSRGYLAMGLGDFLPAVWCMGVAVVVFFFTVFQAGAVIFDRRAYENQIALPVTVRAVIVSRFLSMYVMDLLLGMVVMLSGMAVYGLAVRPGITFYLYGLAATLFLPLLPLTAASVAGALITGISSRWRHKNLVSILLMLGFVCAIMIGSMRMGGMDENQLDSTLRNFAGVLEAQIRHIYLPSLWVAEAMVRGNMVSLALFLGVSVGCFLVFLELLRPVYGRICLLLGAREARGNYRMRRLRARPVLRSLVEREWRRYFACPIYVVNTLTGEVMMVLLAAGVLAVGAESVEAVLGVPGIVGRALPVLLGALPAMMPTTACSISLEGKSLWILQTLPAERRDVMRGKMALNLILALPFWLVSEGILLAALRLGWADAVSLLVMPPVYLVFGARLGLAVNEKLPVFDWESEVRVVKQGASVLVTMLAMLVVVAVPVVALLACPGVSAYPVYGVTAAVLAAGTWAMDQENVRRELLEQRRKK